MVRSLLVGLVLGAGAAAATAAHAADRCLSPNEQKAKTAAHAVVPLSRAMRSVKQHGEIIHALLCERGGRLVYVLTVLAHDGKVARLVVDAVKGCLKSMWAEGEPPGGRAACTDACYEAHGHYINMTDPAATSVSCSFYKMKDGKSWWMNQDFSTL